MSPVQSLPPTVSIAASTLNLSTNNSQTRPRKTVADALSIAAITQKQMSYESDANNVISVEQSAVAAVAAAAAYQFNYSQLYADRAAAAAAMYAAPPLIFSAPPPPPPLSHPPAGNAVFSAAYIKAIQNAVNAGMFSPTHVAPTPTNLRYHNTTTNTLMMPMVPNAVSPSTTINLTTNSGTYLHDKVVLGNNNNNNNSNNTTKLPKACESEGNYFKVPSGKEGSLKHRILTRPQQQLNNTPITNNSQEVTNATMRTFNSTSNFRKGSYIELANGVLRKVEDMRTEDFIQCAERSPHHKLAESTVVKIDTTPTNTVIITFNYDNNRSKADIEVSLDHPFFVYGQGWASFNPDESTKAFGLKCQRLQVGDICISLTKRDTDDINIPNSTTTTTTTTNAKIVINTIASENNRLNHDYAHRTMTPPTNVITATSNHMNMPTTLSTSHYVNTPTAMPFQILPPPHMAPPTTTSLNYPTDMADIVSAYAYHAHRTNNYYSQLPPPHSFHNETVNKDEHYGAGNCQQTTEQDLKSYQTHYESMTAQPNSPHIYQQWQDEPVDATMARKRRWSAPEGICEDEEDNERYHLLRQASIGAGTHQRPQNIDNGISVYKIFKPSPVVATNALVGTSTM